MLIFSVYFQFFQMPRFTLGEMAEVIKKYKNMVRSGGQEGLRVQRHSDKVYREGYASDRRSAHTCG